MSSPASGSSAAASAPIGVATVPDRVVMNNTADVRRDLMEALGAHGGGLIVDLSGTTFMDSSGLSVLVSTYNSATEQGIPFVLTTPQAPIRALLNLTRLNELFTIYLGVDEARAALEAERDG
ncbi:STAS domain-containing protein [Roseospira visakhapatnamensis]|uniref:Anti-sigma factor antagonist n=1 Tax=Roseospira visakhapatnamensis TaxID=390880 RepID=A0A7W6RB66_9PROT|nr:STAS domain-containing protein [Roseospira visakhapatnamensis]MBB4265298.1 anti-sigma B factor antagonist [Roseospira visakhapatnamensis]